MTTYEWQISSELFWTSALVTALVDAAFISMLAWRIKPAKFHEMRWSLVTVAALLWGLFALLLVQSYWDEYYSHFFPTWFRSGGIILYSTPVYAFFALAFHWIALRGRLHPLLTFLGAAAVESVAEHVWGIYGMGILQIPLLRGASPLSILAFALPEYVFYWCMIITVAALLHSAWRAVASTRPAPNRLES